VEERAEVGGRWHGGQISRIELRASSRELRECSSLIALIL
jgi:hypothetical protein